jgi:hypothetical protein
MRTGRCPVPTDVTTLNRRLAGSIAVAFEMFPKKKLICVGTRHRRVLARAVLPHFADGALPRACER